MLAGRRNHEAASRNGAPRAEDRAGGAGEDRAAGHVNAQEAAGMLGMSQRAVRNMVARGRLEGKREGDGAAARLLVSVASVEKLRSERGR